MNKKYYFIHLSQENKYPRILYQNYKNIYILTKEYQDSFIYWIL